jgi:hypothetical protein
LGLARFLRGAHRRISKKHDKRALRNKCFRIGIKVALCEV